jgi:hypothetical protein
MKRALRIAAFVSCVGSAVADSGGPYVAVPDLKPAEVPPVFAIPEESKPLRFFLTHMPRLRWNPKLNEPDSYDREPCAGYYATVASLGQTTGGVILTIRYISDRRIEQGLDYADALLLVARGPHSDPERHLFSPIFYTSAGPSVSDHRAEFYGPERRGAVHVRRELSGTGGFVDHIYLRRGEHGFERFTPARRRK